MTSISEFSTSMTSTPFGKRKHEWHRVESTTLHLILQCFLQKKNFVSGTYYRLQYLNIYRKFLEPCCDSVSFFFIFLFGRSCILLSGEGDKQ